MESEGGMGFPDLIILGLVAAFVLLRLRSMLGTHHEEDVRPKIVIADVQPVAARQADEPPHERPEELPEETEEDIRAQLGGQDEGRVAQQLQAIRVMDKQFRVKDFLKGARMAFEMVIEAYAKGDKATLRQLLSAELLKDFQQALKEREQADEREEVTLISIDDAHITDASLQGQKARLSVMFQSQQMVSVLGKDGKRLPGQSPAMETVEDVWVFERDVRSADPKWTLVQTVAQTDATA